jgi:hypothetical protein
MAGNEINGWGTFALTTAAKTFDVIDIQPPEVIADDEIDTTTNSNGTAAGGVRSFEPSQFITIGNTTLTVAYDSADQADMPTIENVKDTGTLTLKSGGTIVGQGWIKSYTPDTFSPTERPTATVVWVNYTGAAGETLPTVTPAV